MKKKWYMLILYILLLDFFVILRFLDMDHWYVKLLFYAFPGVAIAIHLLSTDKKERIYALRRKTDAAFSPDAAPLSLPFFIALCSVLFLPLLGLFVAIGYFFSNFILVFFHISIYNTGLLLLLPLLRKHFSSRVCATLWILPNILYMAFIPLAHKKQPFWVIPIDVAIGNWLTFIWLIGFAATMLYHVIRHLLYRRKILKNAKRDWDMDLQRIWSDILQSDRFKKQKYLLVRSGEVTTPLSIGFFRKTIYVVLPQKEYTPDELQLILRHEAIHIARRDSLAKFFMVFCAAMCWFNPLSWIALRHCSADMELSCDETVLLDEDQETRQRYADLLLKTAGDDRGFSTCLSASAKTMLYRLSNVLTPQKRHLGAIIAGIATFLLLSTFGLVAVAYTPVKGDTITAGIAEDAPFSNEVIYNSGTERSEYTYADISLLLDYVSDITFYQLTGNYTYPQDDTRIVFYTQDTVYSPVPGVITNAVVELVLKDHTLTVTDFATGGIPEVTTYYHNATIDWDYLMSHATLVTE